MSSNRNTATPGEDTPRSSDEFVLLTPTSEPRAVLTTSNELTTAHKFKQPETTDFNFEIEFDPTPELQRFIINPKTRELDTITEEEIPQQYMSPRDIFTPSSQTKVEDDSPKGLTPAPLRRGVTRSKLLSPDSPGLCSVHGCELPCPHPHKSAVGGPLGFDL
ncbi:hypothetical protein AX16_007010 [Volvariella volvacea WC 439]|nr:hypothetical protein AX16_007010 [Volvariella volvacea WC 439]